MENMFMEKILFATSLQTRIQHQTYSCIALTHHYCMADCSPICTHCFRSHAVLPDFGAYGVHFRCWQN